MSKYVYTATAPDGTSRTRTSDSEYPYATALYYMPRTEYFDKYAKKMRPATEGYWKIVSFSGSYAAAAKSNGGSSNWDRRVVVETTRVEKATRSPKVAGE